MERLEPFGNAAPEPVFLTRNLTLAAPIRLIKERHICLSLTGGGAAPALALDALGWSRTIDWPERCAALGLTQGSCIDVLYRLRINVYMQRKHLQLELVDLRLFEPAP